MTKMDPNISLEDVQAFFKNDHWAYDHLGARVLEAGPGHAKVTCPVTDGVKNGFGGVMGGALFTLADYALAIACNVGEEPTVSVSNTMEFLSATKGQTLFAEAFADKSGRNLGFYTVDVTDELGTKVARMSATCFRRA